MKQIPVNRQASLDDLIIELAASGKSCEDISQRLGGTISPARVKLRMDQILSAPDWLTKAQQEEALIRLLQVGIVELRDNPTLDAAKLLRLQINDVLDRLRERGRATEQDLQTWNANVGRELGRIVDKALSYMQGALREQVDPQTWERVKIEAMEMAWQDIRAGQAEADALPQ